MLTILLIGNGSWAQNYVKTLRNFKEVTLIVATYDWRQFLHQVDGVIICTPPESHISIAVETLAYGLPTMIEKPLSLNYEQCLFLKKFSALILVNHIHLFSQRYQEIKRQILSVYNLCTIGCGVGPPRNYSSLWDYGPHDLSLILDLTQSYPKEIKISEYNNLFHLKMKFSNLTTNSIFGSGAQEKIRFLNVNDQIYDLQHISLDFPLTNAIKSFIKIINGYDDPRQGLELSLKIIKLLQTCCLQLR